MILRLRGARRACGVTLTELMLAVTIISLGVLAFIGAMKYIAVSLHNSRMKSLATNLGQQQIEYLKGQGYYNVYVTSLTAYATDPYGGFSYDTVYYPPSTTTISGSQFTTYTMVQLVMPASNGLVPADASYPDTGEKMLQVNVVWGQHTSAATTHVYNVTNMIENSNVASMDSLITGTISPACSSIKVIQNSNWGAGCQTGSYSLSVVHGSYTVVASSGPYYNAEQNVYAPPGGQVTANFNLVKINSGTISGYVYLNTGLYISQIVASTSTKSCNGNGCALGGPNTVEYIELFNPSTYTITIGACSAGVVPDCAVGTESVIINTNYGGGTGASCNGVGTNCTDILKNNAGKYNALSVAPGYYYLIANYSKFVASGTTITADAYYSGKLIPEYKYGGVQVCPASAVDGTSHCFPGTTAAYSYSAYDEVGWQGAGMPAGFCTASVGTNPSGGTWCNGYWDVAAGWIQGSYIPTDANCGMNTGASGNISPACQSSPWNGNQLVRYSMPVQPVLPCSASTPTHHQGWAASMPPFCLVPNAYWIDMIRGNYGSAYNSRDNAADFMFPVNGMPLTQKLQYQPYNQSSPNSLTGGAWPITAGMVTGRAAVGATSGVPVVWVTTDAYSSAALATVAGGYKGYQGGDNVYYNQFSINPVTVGTWTVNAIYYDQCTYVQIGVAYAGPCTGYTTTCVVAPGTSSCAAYAPQTTNNVGVQYVSVTQGNNTTIRNASTLPGAFDNSPPLGLPSQDTIILNANNNTCYITGQVADINGIGINNIIVQAAASQATSNSQGFYITTFPCYVYGNNEVPVMVNPNNTNASYGTISQLVYVNTTQLSATAHYNFVLGPAVTLSGYACTNGASCTSSALPNLQFMATAYGGYEVSQNATDSTGHFYLNNINSTGTVSVAPILSAGQYSSPSSQSVTFDGTESNVWVASFTITGAMTTITGTVQYNGSAVTSGALIVASTATVTNPPAAIYAASSTVITSVFSVSSLPDGSYVLPVMASTTPYNILVELPTYASTGTVTTVSKFFTITASTGGYTLSGQTLSLP